MYGRVRRDYTDAEFSGVVDEEVLSFGMAG